MGTPPPELVDDLVEEVLLRVSPDDPARLVRAALVCKRWCRIVSDRRFRRRLRELHRAPPMLGFFYYRRAPLRFESTSSFRRSYDGDITWCVLDARHGRVLIKRFSFVPGEGDLIVWDPIAGDLQRLPMPQVQYTYWGAALLCAAAGCDHLDCGCSSFLVVFAGTEESGWSTSACVYSSESGAWSEQISVGHTSDHIDMGPSVLVGNALFFLLRSSSGVLKYDTGTREICVIDLPSACHRQHIVLTTTEDDRLGFATVHASKLFLWSREDGPDGDAEWVQGRVIELEALLPVEALSTTIKVIGFADGVGVILVTFDGFFTVDPKSSRVRKIGKGFSYYDVVPYVSFCTPVLGAASSGAGHRDQERLPSTASKTEGARVRAARRSRENRSSS